LVRRVFSLLLMAVVVMVTMGCGGRTDGVFALPRWSAELPGRHEPLDVTLPAHLDAFLPRGPAEYVLRTSVDVPPAMRGLPLTLAIAHMPAVATLKVDGNQAVPVDASTFDSYRSAGPLRWRIPEEASRDGRLDLELHVSHRFVRSAWIDSVPELTTHPLGGAGLAAVQSFNTTSAIGALAAALFVAFFYAVLFLSLRDKRRASYGWFALGALCGLPYPAFLLGISQPLFGVYEGPFMMGFLVLGSLAAMAFSRAYVNAPPPSRAWIFVFLGAVVVAVVARSPFVSILVMGPVVVAVTLAGVLAQIMFLVRLRHERAGAGRAQRPPAMIYFIAFAWPATVLLGLPDILAWLGQGEPSYGIRTACLGITGISLYQAVALSREHLVSLKRADELNVELGERVKLLQAKHREVELLNDELRRQIAARSRELAEKLSRMEDEEISPPPVLETGTVVENRYRVIKELGSGGMGTVYEVERITDGKHFALKALAGGGDAQARARFAREAQIVANVNHPNVVSIVDVDVAKSGFIFLVMELVESGTTLSDVRRRNRDVPWTLGVLAQVAEGIDAIHGAGIIHRDLKPGNILLSRGTDGRKPLVKITDFGISSLVPDGTRISAMERAAMVASSLPDAQELLDPFAAARRAPEGTPAVRISELEATRKKSAKLPAPAPAPETAGAPASLDRDSGLVTSARPDILLELEYQPALPVDTASLATEKVATRPIAAAGSKAGAEHTKQEGAVERARGSDRPAEHAVPATPPVASRTPSGPSSPLTETGLIFGTPQYMAQELTTGTKNATRASDVFSLGIIAFEVLTGKRPFPEAPVSAKLSGRALPRAMPFRAAIPTLPLEIAELLDRAMQHDPRTRPTANEMAIGLREAADRLAR
jgi:serine/threonine protein kinase